MTADRPGSIQILTVNISPGKGTAKKPVPSIDLDTGGIIGDAHYGTPGRQVSLLDRTLVEGMIESRGDMSIPEGTMGENITFRCLSPLEFHIGDTISFADALLLIEQIGKECHGEGCAIFRSVGECVMPANGLFCSVVKEGRLTPGEIGEVIRKTQLDHD